MNGIFNASMNICFGYSIDDSNKYLKIHMFCEEIGIKHGFTYIPVCSLRILYNCKFILMATSLGTNAVVVTRVSCII